MSTTATRKKFTWEWGYAKPGSKSKGFDLVSFTPKEKDRRAYLEILSKDPRSEDKKQLISRLVTEFSRLYWRYRNRLEVASGRQPMTATEEDKALYGQVAVKLIQHNLTPNQVVSFWHRRMTNLFGAGGGTPSVAFLNTSFALKTVAANKHELDKKIEHRRFYKTDVLDPRLRSALVANGFETHHYSDLYLLKIQNLAMNMASGNRVFISHGKLKEIVEWIALVLYYTGSD